VPRTQIPVRQLTPGAGVFDPESPIFGRRDLFPRLRRKSGLCYTADANSPFEAYIYVR
jgi:hypothetical protein